MFLNRGAKKVLSSIFYSNYLNSSKLFLGGPNIVHKSLFKNPICYPFVCKGIKTKLEGAKSNQFLF